MRWAPLHPRQMLAIAAASFATLMLLMLLAASDLSSLDFSIGSRAVDAGDTPVMVPDRVEVSEAPPPVWVTDPLAPPLSHLDPQ